MILAVINGSRPHYYPLTLSKLQIQNRHSVQGGRFVFITVYSEEPGRVGKISESLTGVCDQVNSGGSLTNYRQNILANESSCMIRLFIEHWLPV